MATRRFVLVLAGITSLAGAVASQEVFAQSARALDVRSEQVIQHWTPARKAAAIARDLAIDPRGLAYLRGPGNSFTPYGHDIAAEAGRPGGGGGGGGQGGGGGAVANAEWTKDGVVQNAVGRIYFEMPVDPQRSDWDGYVCSGTAVNDGGTSGRSIILTAAHCVYDDLNKAFARNVMFIPNQADTLGAGTDLNCTNDPKGCWVPNLGVVDNNWATGTFPNNVAWDYAFYVVSDTAAHQAGYTAAPDALDSAVTAMTVSFTAPAYSTLSHALGYSYSRDPQFMYCADKLGQASTVNYWLGKCGLSGGSSGGPWSQPFNTTTGNGPIISVNSWGYTNQPGMAGPKLAGTSASCVFGVAKGAAMGSFPHGDAGVKVNC